MDDYEGGDMNWEAKRLEREIDDFTYPAVLPRSQKQLLAAKLIEVTRAEREDTMALENRLTDVGRQRSVTVAELPNNAKDLAKKLAASYAKTQSLEKAFNAINGVSHQYGTFYVQASETERLQQRSVLQDKITARKAAASRAVEEIRAIAKGLAEAQVRDLKAKIAKTDPALVASLDSIGQKALPAVTVTAIEKSAGKGRTKKAKE
jgi:hypothetical protein